MMFDGGNYPSSVPDPEPDPDGIGSSVSTWMSVRRLAVGLVRFLNIFSWCRRRKEIRRLMVR
jgi:hypothetical protein